MSGDMYSDWERDRMKDKMSERAVTIWTRICLTAIVMIVIIFGLLMWMKEKDLAWKHIYERRVEEMIDDRFEEMIYDWEHR